MLNEETRRKLREMNFGELVEAIDRQEKQAEYLALPFDDRINLAVDYAYSAKYNTKVHRLIKAAKFRLADAAFSNIHYENRGLDKDLLLTLGTCGFISNNQPVVINGFTGSGKSYLACAIGRQACMQGLPLKIYPCSRFDGVAQRSNIDENRQIQASEEVQRIQAAHPR